MLCSDKATNINNQSALLIDRWFQQLLVRVWFMYIYGINEILIPDFYVKS